MTTEDYREKFGHELRQHFSDPWFAALLNTLHAEHPVKHIAAEPDGNKASAPLLFLARIEGYERAIKVVSDCAQEITKPLAENPSDYSQDEMANLTPEIPLP